MQFPPWDIGATPPINVTVQQPPGYFPEWLKIVTSYFWMIRDRMRTMGVTKSVGRHFASYPGSSARLLNYTQDL
jgi:hypothetical protein